MRRLTVLLSAAPIMALGWAATASPGQLGDAARVDVRASTLLPLSDTPPTIRGTPGHGEIDRALRRATAKASSVVPGGPGPHLSAQVVRRTPLRASPGGSLVVSIGHRTRFGGPQIVAVVARRGRWLGVLHQWMPNGKAGWIDSRDTKLLRQPFAIEVDRSARTALVRHDGEAVYRFPVGIGRAGSVTPTGRFAITDRLVADPGSTYGCCILAMSGTQPFLPTGWSGGDRLALHGSQDDHVGTATSAGCLNLRERDLRWLMKRIPVGARVTVRA